MAGREGDAPVDEHIQSRVWYQLMRDLAKKDLSKEVINVSVFWNATMEEHNMTMRTLTSVGHRLVQHIYRGVAGREGYEPIDEHIQSRVWYQLMRHVANWQEFSDEVFIVSAFCNNRMKEHMTRRTLTSLGHRLVRHIRTERYGRDSYDPVDERHQGRLLQQVYWDGLDFTSSLGTHPDRLDALTELIFQALLILQQREGPPLGSECLFVGPYTVYRCEDQVTRRLVPERPDAYCEVNHTYRSRSWGENAPPMFLDSTSLLPVIRRDLHPARLCKIHEAVMQDCIHQLIWTRALPE